MLTSTSKLLALAVAPSALALLIAAIPGTPPGIFLGGLLTLPLAAAGALMLSLRTTSLGMSAVGAAGAFVIRIGGAGAAARLGPGDAHAPAILATIAACLFASLAAEMASWFIAMRSQLAGNATDA